MEKNKKMKNYPRLDYVDIVKGLGITLMVFGHGYSQNTNFPVMIWIYSFHMPLFFITTGVLYGIKREKNLKFNWRQKVKTLLVPFILWNTVYQIFISILKIIGGAPVKKTIISNLQMVLYLGGSAMWFLPVMFFASMFFLITIKNQKLNISVTILMCIIGLFASIHVTIIETILKAFVATAFIGIGFYLFPLFINKIRIKYLVILFFINMVLIFENGMVSIADRIYHNPIFYYINGSIGTLLIYQVAMNMKKKNCFYRFFRYWGKNSIKILCFHGFIIQIIRLIDYQLLKNMLPHLKKMEGIIMTLLVMVALTVMMPLINKFLNWTFGMKNCKRSIDKND